MPAPPPPDPLTPPQPTLPLPPPLLSAPPAPPKVFQGILLAQRDRFAARPAPGTACTAGTGTPPPYGGRVTSPEGYLLALWAHECQRVFGDKLVSLEDKGWVAGTVAELAKQVGTDLLLRGV